MLQLASQSPPGTFNMPEINKAVLAAANVDNPDRFITAQVQAVPQDPIADIMSAAKGRPIKAFPGQDHDAHIAVKTAYMQDPMNGANPVMKNVQPLLMNNIREHMVLRFQEQMGGLMKAQEGQVDQGASLGMIMSQSAQQILQANQIAAQGGLASIEQQNIELQKSELELKKQREMVDAQFKDREIKLKEKEVDIDAMVEAAKIQEKKDNDSNNLTAKVVMDLLKMIDKNKLNGTQELQAGGDVQAFKQAADMAATQQQTTMPMQTTMPQPQNFLEMARQAQSVPTDPQPTETVPEQQEKEQPKMTMGKFTYEQEIGPNSTKLHHPTKTSGVTIGAGYDMKEKSQDTIIEDMTSVGVPEDKADRLSLASGLSGKEASDFVKENSDLEITLPEQEKLFTIKISEAFKQADNDLRSLGYDPDQVPQDKKEVLADYTYNLGNLITFPKFTDAFLKGDLKVALAESDRYSNGKPLTRRNKATRAIVTEILTA